jgi:hypothetical protein
MKFVETVRIGRNCRRIIFQSFYGTLIVDAIGVGLAAAGLLNPLLAARAMNIPLIRLKAAICPQSHLLTRDYSMKLTTVNVKKQGPAAVLILHCRSPLSLALQARR